MAYKTSHRLVGELAETRRLMRLGQKDLAELLGVSRTTISSWESSSPPRWIELLCSGLKASRVLPHIGLPITGTELIQARKALGYNQMEFAQRLAMSRSTISRWESDTPPRWVSFAIASLAFKD